MNTFVSNHFSDSEHNINDMKIQIVDVVSNYADKEDLTNKLNKSEDFFIKTLNTLHPLGLNDKVLGGNCVS